MRKFIDVDGTEKITEFAYTNDMGDVEFVKLSDDTAGCVTIEDDNQDCTMFIKDIPKLITALQAAQKEWGSTNG